MERLTDAGAVFETRHCGSSTLNYHRHGMSFATIVLDGAYTEVRDDAPRACARGSIVVHDPNEEHADHFASDTRCLNIELPAHAAAALGGTTLAMDSSLAAAIGELAQAFYARGSDERRLSAAVLRTRQLLQPMVNEPPPAWLQAAIDAFAWPDQTPLRSAARIAGVHQTHFSREFHRRLGMTPSAYRRRERVQLASHLLLASSASLARIALRCGFSDQSHLTRTFHAALGLTPAAYRRIFAR